MKKIAEEILNTLTDNVFCIESLREQYERYFVNGDTTADKKCE